MPYIFCIIFFGLSVITFGNYPFEIEADKLNYKNETSELNASGNVIIKYKSYIMTSEKVHYSKLSNQLLFEEKVTINDDQSNELIADAIRFNLTTDIGRIYNGRIKSNKDIIISAKQIELNDSSNIFHDCKITSCTSKKPEWYIKSKQFNVNRKTNLIRAKKNFFYFYNVPLLYIPDYSQSLSNTQYSNKSITEFGHNQIDKAYLNVYGGYILTKQLTGQAGIGISQERGFRYGMTNTLSFTKNQSLKLLTYNVEKTGFEGGLTYSYLNILNKDQTNQLINLLLLSDNKNSPSSKLTAAYLFDESSYNELFHAIPELKFELKSFKGLYMDNLDSLLLYGYYKDRNNQGNKFQGKIVGAKNLIQLSKKNKLDNKLTIDYRSYESNNTSWNRIYNKLIYSFPLLSLNNQVSYTKLIQKSGDSPFIFDKINEITNDEVSIVTTIDFSPIILSTELDYEIEKESFRNLIYSIKWASQCWEVSINVNSIWEEISMGVSIPNF